jgi:hypothetical protein
MNSMTKIEASTQSILAAIAAKNAWQTSTTHKTPVTYDVTASENPFPCNESSPKQPLQVKPQKTPKNKSEKKCTEPNITRIVAKNGAVSFRVQIRRTEAGKKYSETKTFTHLPNAKKWRNQILAEIDKNGVPLTNEVDHTIADVIAKRFESPKALGRSARQNLEFIRNHEFGQTVNRHAKVTHLGGL